MHEKEHLRDADELLAWIDNVEGLYLEKEDINNCADVENVEGRISNLVMLAMTGYEDTYPHTKFDNGTFRLTFEALMEEYREAEVDNG